MSTCDIQSSGTIELYFYNELSSGERARIDRHLRDCAECRHVLADLQTIRDALGARPIVEGPPNGDWTAFMARLDAGVARERRPDVAGGAATATVVPFRGKRSLMPMLAMAALLALVTISVVFVARQRTAPDDQGEFVTTGSSPLAQPVSDDPGRAAHSPSTALVALSAQHFERSKLVVLGLTTKDPRAAEAANFEYERQLASTLLDDTRLYRLAAEERGLTALAGVMRDLELVLLQTSMSERSDGESLEQLQRLIRRRDLVTKMEVVNTSGL
jgi:hypothetical protein